MGQDFLDRQYKAVGKRFLYAVSDIFRDDYNLQYVFDIELKLPCLCFDLHFGPIS